MSARARLLPACALALAVIAGLLRVSRAGDGTVPWPGGVAPAQTEIDAQREAADALYLRERQDEFLEAAERGEDREHITIAQADIDAGKYDLAQLFRVGDALFEHEFRAQDGLGAKDKKRLARVHDHLRGGLDTYSCAGCHATGGLDGAGAGTQNAYVTGDGDSLSSANIRNAPHVLGLGLVQELGLEMSRDLGLQRDAATSEAVASGAAVPIALASKGVSFGTLIALPDGSFDATGLEGVDADLIVKPFGWKGEVARLRRFVEEAARIHFGVQAHTLALAHKDDPAPELLGDGYWFDPDEDGVERELEEGSITAGAVYLAQLEVPVILPPFDAGLRARWARGSGNFDALGCADCHTRALPIDTQTWQEHPDTTGGPPVEIQLLVDGEPPRGSSLVELFSDLKRHDMGDELADPHESASGVPRAAFLTRPLWGLAETAPYLHDGRATTLDEAIRAHGGEGDDARQRYLALDPDAQRDLAVFLLSLSRTPRLRVPR